MKKKKAPIKKKKISKAKGKKKTEEQRLQELFDIYLQQARLEIIV